MLCRVVLALLAGLGALPAPAGAQDAPALLERARAALGQASGEQLEGRGKAHANGLDGTLRAVLGAGGAFRVEIDSALSEHAGFDGTTPWSRDHTGLARRLALEDADRWKLFAWVLSGHWSTAPELAIRAGKRSTELELALTGTPMVMSLTLDPATFLPAELEYLDDGGPARWTFSDYREVAGRRRAHRWTLREGSDEDGSLDTFEIETWKPVPGDAAAFITSFVPPRDVEFDPDGDPELDVVRVASGHLLVEPWVEDDTVGLFIFDTGAGAMTIDPEVADELGLAEFGEVVAVGVGGRTTTSFRRGTRFELGPLALTDPVYVELDLAFLEPIFGHKVAGIVGYDLLARCVAEIETRTPRIALHDPTRFQLAGATWQALAVNENTPAVHGRFGAGAGHGAREGLFRLDTGANGTLSFHAPAVQEFGLLEGRTVTGAIGGGVGGASELKSGSIDWFELAGHRFERPTVQFSLAEGGAFTDRYTAGNIGQAFLAPFRIVLDYPGDRIAFVALGK